MAQPATAQQLHSQLDTANNQLDNEQPAWRQLRQPTLQPKLTTTKATELARDGSKLASVTAHHTGLVGAAHVMPQQKE
jgi:hypothetical protein